MRKDWLKGEKVPKGWKPDMEWQLMVGEAYDENWEPKNHSLDANRYINIHILIFIVSNVILLLPCNVALI